MSGLKARYTHTATGDSSRSAHPKHSPQNNHQSPLSWSIKCYDFHGVCRWRGLLTLGCFRSQPSSHNTYISTANSLLHTQLDWSVSPHGRLTNARMAACALQVKAASGGVHLYYHHLPLARSLADYLGHAKVTVQTRTLGGLFNQLHNGTGIVCVYLRFHITLSLISLHPKLEYTAYSTWNTATQTLTIY